MICNLFPLSTNNSKVSIAISSIFRRRLLLYFYTSIPSSFSFRMDSHNKNNFLFNRGDHDRLCFLIPTSSSGRKKTNKTWPQISNHTFFSSPSLSPSIPASSIANVQDRQQAGTEEEGLGQDCPRHWGRGGARDRKGQWIGRRSFPTNLRYGHGRNSSCDDEEFCRKWWHCVEHQLGWGRPGQGGCQAAGRMRVSSMEMSRRYVVALLWAVKCVYDLFLSTVVPCFLSHLYQICSPVFFQSLLCCTILMPIHQDPFPPLSNQSFITHTRTFPVYFVSLLLVLSISLFSTLTGLFPFQ